MIDHFTKYSEEEEEEEEEPKRACYSLILTKEHQHTGLYKECTFIVAKFAKGYQQDKSRIFSPAIGRDSNSMIFWPQQEGKEAVNIDEGAVV